MGIFSKLFGKKNQGQKPGPAEVKKAEAAKPSTAGVKERQAAQPPATRQPQPATAAHDFEGMVRSQAVEPLLRLLKDPDRHVGEKAAKALGEIGAPGAVEPLFDVLKNDKGDVGRSAFMALYKIGVFPEQLVFDYLNSLSYGDLDWSVSVSGKIFGLDKINSLPLLKEILRTTKIQRLKIYLAKRITELECPEDDTLNGLTKAMMDGLSHAREAYKIDNAVRLISQEWFASEKSRPLCPFLGEYLTYHVPVCSCHFRSTLAIIKKMGSNAEELVPVLLPILMMDSYHMDHAVETLNKIDGKWVNSQCAQELIPSIVKGLDVNGEGRAYAIERLGLFGPAAVAYTPKLMDFVSDVSLGSGFREHALRSLSKIKPQSPEVKDICINLIVKDSSLSTLAGNILRDDYGVTDLDSLKAGVGSSPSASDEPPKILGILVLSHGELRNKSGLLWEITIQQNKLGFSREGAREVVMTAGDSFADMAYVYASIRSNFSNLGERDLLSRTYSYDFRSKEGDFGKYYVIFNKPK